MAVEHSRLVLCDVSKHSLVLDILRTVGDILNGMCAHHHLGKRKRQYKAMVRGLNTDLCVVIHKLHSFP